MTYSHVISAAKNGKQKMTIHYTVDITGRDKRGAEGAEGGCTLSNWDNQTNSLMESGY